MRRVLGNRLAAVVMLVMITAGVLACAPSSESGPVATPTPTPTPTVCEKAEALIAEGDPSAAKELIQDARQPALDRLGAEAGLPGDRSLARQCEQVWKRALVADQASAPTSSAQQAGKAWDKWVAAWLTPFATGITWALAAAAAAIVLARVLVLAVPWDMVRVRSNAGWLRRGPLSFLLIIGGCLGFVAAISFDAHVLWPILLGAIVTFGVLWASYWLGARPRVAIRVTDAEGSASQAASTALAQIVDELGAAPAGGIERPSASDVTELSDVTSKVSDNTFVTLLAGLFQFVANTSPWSVEVQQLTGEQTVLVHWNGRVIARERVTAKRLALPEKLSTDEAMLRLDAAVAAVAIADRYVDMTGLYGAERWESVGLHALAAVAGDPSQKSALLLTAVALDPANHLVRVALENELHRGELETSGIDAYLGSLESEIDDLADRAGRTRPTLDPPTAPFPPPRRRRHAHPDPIALLTRVLMVWASMLCNRIAATAPGTDFTRMRPDHDIRRLELLVSCVTTLSGEAKLADTPERVRQSVFAEVLRGRSALALRRLQDSGLFAGQATELEELADATASWYTPTQASARRDVAYAYACYLTMSATDPVPPAGRDAITERLKTALHDEGLIGWAFKDPELAAARPGRWAVFHPTGPESVWDVEPLAAHQDALAKAGIVSAAALATASNDVRRHLGISKAEFAHLTSVAALAALLDQKTTDEDRRLRIPSFLEALVKAGVDSPPALRAATADLLIEKLGPITDRTPADDPATSIPQLVEVWTGSPPPTA